MAVIDMNFHTLLLALEMANDNDYTFLLRFHKAQQLRISKGRIHIYIYIYNHIYIADHYLHTLCNIIATKTIISVSV